MTEQARQREFADVVATALSEQANAERYKHPRLRGEPNSHPLEFDRNGFPVAQRIPSFVTRVARLLSP